jgi:hypothetical protein
MSRIFFLLFLLNFTKSFTQAEFTSIEVPYSQNFNGVSITGTDGGTQTWTNNSTILGWYLQQHTNSTTSVRLELTPTSTLQNTGGHYIIKNGATDISIGTRPSGSYTNAYIGLRLKNNTGTTIHSIKVEYYGEQYSIAENNGNVNNLQFHYQKVSSPSTITSLTSGTWTALTALNFNQLWTHTDSPTKGGTACTGTSNQCLGLNGNDASNRTKLTLNFDVTLNVGDEIMFRWLDVDNAANDPHLQIDDVIVTPYDDLTSVVLPIELLNFNATCENEESSLTWSTASERENDFFEIEQTIDGKEYFKIGKIQGNGNSNQLNTYNFNFQNQYKESYIRLVQTDFNGHQTYSDFIVARCNKDNEKFIFYPNPTNGVITLELENEFDLEIVNSTGKIVHKLNNISGNNTLDLTFLEAAVYYLKIHKDNALHHTKKLVIN